MSVVVDVVKLTLQPGSITAIVFLLTLGVALLRDGNAEAALEHFRSARILLGG